jgi:integrase/recombinase XerD
MANRKIALVIYAKTDEGWRRYPVVIGDGKKIRPGYGMVQGEPVLFKQCRYELRSYKGSKLTYEPAGDDAAAAFSKWKNVRDTMAAVAKAKVAGLKVLEDEKRKLLRNEADRYIQRAEDRSKAEAAVTYRKALDHFLEAMDKRGTRFIDEVDEDAMIAFQGWLRKHGNGDRTVRNKHDAVRGFLMWAGADKKELGPKPTYEKKLPRAYSRDEVSSLLGAANPYTSVMIDVLRMAGLREQEAAHLEWDDLDLKRAILHVRSKPDEGFTIKDKEERDIPLPAELVTTLRQWQGKHKGKRWVLGTRNDKPNTKMLLFLKWCAKRANLNCNKCDACKDRGECEKYQLHSFRRTYATRLARAGVDVHAIRDLLGHSDLQTTIAYLAEMETEEKGHAIKRVKW